MSHVMISRLIAVVFVIAAIVAPAASAQPIDPPGSPQATYHVSKGETHYGGPSSSGTTSSGFDWSDAAVGAGAMLIVLGAGGAAVVTVRRSRDRSHSLVAS